MATVQWVLSPEVSVSGPSQVTFRFPAEESPSPELDPALSIWLVTAVATCSALSESGADAAAGVSAAPTSAEGAVVPVWAPQPLTMLPTARAAGIASKRRLIVLFAVMIVHLDARLGGLAQQG
jgi:hypothetical protein